MKNTRSPVMLSSMYRYIYLSAILCVTVLLGACGTMRSSVVVEPAAGTTYGRTVAGTRTTTAPKAAHASAAPGGTYAVTKGDTLYSIAFRNGVDFRNLAQWNGIPEPYTIWPGQKLTLSPSSTAGTTDVAVAASPVSAAQVPSTVAAAVAPVFEPVTTPAAVVLPAAAPKIATGTHTTVSAPVTPIAVTVPTPAVSASGVPAIVPVAGVPAPAPAAVPPPAPPASGVSRAVSGVSWRWPADGKLTGKFSSSDAIPGIEIAGKAGDAVRAAAEGIVVYSGNGLVGYGELIIIKHNDSFLSAYGHNRKRLVKEGQRVSSGQQIAEMGSTGASRNELEFQIRKNGSPVDPLGYLPAR